MHRSGGIMRFLSPKLARESWDQCEVLSLLLFGVSAGDPKVGVTTLRGRRAIHIFHLFRGPT